MQGGGSYIRVDLEEVKPQDQSVTSEEKERKLLPHERKKIRTTIEHQFKAVISITPPTSDSLAEFDRLLADDQLKQLERLMTELELKNTPNRILEPKSFLHNARLQPLLVQMLEDIAQYRAYLERFIIRFGAENECTAPKQNPQSKSDTTKPSAPIHYAVLQLNGDFLDWLLARDNTDVNLRNSFKQTALTLLCENYDQCMRKSMQACPPGWLAEIRTLIKQLLEKGADFNICSIHMKLPFELLLKHCGHDETRSFVEQCVDKAQCALAICSINERNERVVGFYNNNPNVCVTVELLEIFLRYNDCSNFAKYLAHFEVNEANVKKVIRLLLHTACDQKVIRVFEVSFRSRRETHLQGNPAQTYTGCNYSSKDPNAPDTSSVDLNREYSRFESTEVQKGSELEHRVELKGLLKKVCLMADLPLLQRLLAKISDLIVLNDDPLLVNTLSKAYDFKRRIEERNALLACAEYLATQETIHMSKKDNSGNTSLHLALKYGFESVALALLRQRHTYLGMCNNDNLTPLDYGTYGFWRKYLDQCIEIDLKRSIPDRDEIRFNLNGFYSSLQDKAFQDVANPYR
uniref:ANK_REP_REGION domain-containing protein n=1 Tax=Anopheles funestus TaxID=62324 RepID=A0A4Y0BR11_ANOFN